MNNNVFAVLLDITSIQKYIFESNKLKDNLGASYLIQEIYNSFLKDSYKKTMDIDINIDDWKTENLVLPKTPIGYIGGGNALVFFEKESNAIDFIKEWTKELLVKAPDCKPISAINNFDLNSFEKSKKELFQKLRENKAKYSYSTTIPRHGFNLECPRTGLSAEEFYIEEEEAKNKTSKKLDASIEAYVSMVSMAKIKASKESNKSYKNYLSKYPNIEFPDKLENLGQKENEKNHIAIVHIDGNDIGEKFRKTKSLDEIRELSKEISSITEKAFQALINWVVENIPNIKSSEFDIKENFLPIRPIIIGGDDITFVCAGKLGIPFAKVFLEKFEKNSGDLKLTACAGVSIIKSKYPFFKGYQIAEELCANAKNFRKKEKINSSMIDFNISSGGIFGSLEEIRNNHFSTPNGSLIFRPYLISKEKNIRNFDNFIKNSIELKNNFPSSKIKELREIITLGDDSIKTFIEALGYRNKILPKIEGKHYEKDLFQDSVTPYLDMVELIEFYPQFLLKEG
ncbi:MAG: hypothetical protein U0457_12740 [Candidatus Sericytochromatia bacterium]